MESVEDDEDVRVAPQDIGKPDLTPLRLNQQKHFPCVGGPLREV
jgi:hypothetical protein